MANLAVALKSAESDVQLVHNDEDITLGFPLNVPVNCIFLGIIDDSKAKAEYKGTDERFWWCDQPFKGFRVLGNSVSADINDDNWNFYSVVGPSFIKGAPDLASAKFRKEQTDLVINIAEDGTVDTKRRIFAVKCIQGAPTRTGYDPNKKVFSPA